MAFNLTSIIGGYAPGSVDTTQVFALGTMAKGTDPTYGEGEFIYLKGVASTAAGSVVVYDQYAGTTALATTGSRGPVAVAMASTVANTYGWYQVSGAAVVLSTTAVAGNKIYLSGTPGTVLSTVSATNGLDGGIFKTANGTPGAGQAVAQLSRASATGNG